MEPPTTEFLEFLADAALAARSLEYKCVNLKFALETLLVEPDAELGEIIQYTRQVQRVSSRWHKLAALAMGREPGPPHEDVRPSEPPDFDQAAADAAFEKLAAMDDILAMEPDRAA
jgi:hypothetical protein